MVVDGELVADSTVGCREGVWIQHLAIGRAGTDYGRSHWKDALLDQDAAYSPRDSGGFV